MNSSVIKILKVFALLIVLYFLCDAISAIDVSPSKNTMQVFQKKAAIDKMDDLTDLKYKANEYVDDLARIHERDASGAILNMNLLIVLICIQVYLNYYDRKAPTSEDANN